jgi:hypothetical protein
MLYTAQECDAIRALLSNPQCSLRSLTLDRCNLGLAGTVGIIQALAGEEQLLHKNQQVWKLMHQPQ